MTDFFENVGVEIKNNILKVNLKEYPVINQLIIVGEKSKKFKNEIKKLLNLKKKIHLLKTI